METLQDVLAAFGRCPEEPAIISFHSGTEKILTYSQLGKLTRRLATGLIMRGVAVGDPIGICADNRTEAVAVRLALIAVNAVIVSIDQDLTPDQLSHVLENSGCKSLFMLSRDVSRLQPSCDRGVEIFLLDGEPNHGLRAENWQNLLLDQNPSHRLATPDQTAALFYTSGTTGPPKGVPLSHENIIFNLNALLALKLVGPGDRVLLPLPLHHSYPFIVGMLTPFAAGAAIVMPAEVTGPAIQAALHDAKPAVMIGVPRLYETILAGIEARVSVRGKLQRNLFNWLLHTSIAAQHRFGLYIGRSLFRSVHNSLTPSLRVLVSGGARLKPETGRRLEGLGWKVLSGYGLVETSSVATFNPPDGARLESAGKPVPGVEIRIDQPDINGHGEILIKGPNVFRGYYMNPQANRMALTEDGWFRSGDLGALDADGYLYVLGRVNEMIVLPDGKNVAPENVEASYRESLYVHDIAVIERAGGLAALVVPDFEAIRTAESARIEDLIRVSLAETSRKLPTYQRLSDFVITRETLPRTRLGKFRRYCLPEIYERAQEGMRPPITSLSESDRELLRSSRIAPLWDWLEHRFEGQGITPNTSPQLELGVDSLSWVTLGLEIEERFGFHFSEETLAKVVVLRDILEAIQELPESHMPGKVTSSGVRHEFAAEIDRWLAPTGPWVARFSRGLHAVVRFSAQVLFHLQVEGLQNVPTSGPFIIAANHASDLDPFMIGAALPFDRMREAYWGADFKRALSHPVLGRLARMAHLFPVDDRKPIESLRIGTAVLKRGQILIWFPEEWRSPTGELQRFLPGIAHLAIKSNAPVVPAHIEGTFQAMPRTRRVPRPGQVRVVFGNPVSAGDLEVRGRGESQTERVCDGLRELIASLAPA